MIKIFFVDKITHKKKKITKNVTHVQMSGHYLFITHLVNDNFHFEHINIEWNDSEILVLEKQEELE
jgi:hypothetical protein